MKTSGCSWYWGIAAVIALPAQVLAQSRSIATEVQTAVKPVNAVALETSFAGFDKPVSIVSLAGRRGGSVKVHNDMTLSGVTADNSAINVSSGNNAITAGSFSNMSGMPVVIQNSGSNVLIQNAVILNLQIN